MFRRLLFDDSAAWFTLIAFVTALTIYVAFAWRALRMKRGQVSFFEHLPFATETPAASGEAMTSNAAPRADGGIGAARGGPAAGIPRQAVNQPPQPSRPES